MEEIETIRDLEYDEIETISHEIQSGEDSGIVITSDGIQVEWELVLSQLSKD